MDPSKPTKLLVERWRAVKHTAHVSNARHVPPGHVLVKGCRALEHAGHVGDMGHVPLGKVLVEGSCTLEHLRHVGDMGHVPLPDWSVIFGAITRFRFLKARVDSLLELHCALW